MTCILEYTHYLFMKIGIKHNQVEIALQALNGSVEKVVFGTASLQKKRFRAAAHFLLI